HEISRQCGQTVIATFGPTECYCQVLPLDKSSFAQSLSKCCNDTGRFAGCSAAEKPDHRHSGLCSCRKRPRRYCTSSKAKKFTSYHETYPQRLRTRVIVSTSIGLVEGVGPLRCEFPPWVRSAH